MSVVERLFHFGNKDNKTVEGQTEQQARIQLQSFLDKNYKAIRAMRSYNQLRDKYNIDLQQLGRLEEYIKKESGGRMHWSYGTLCEISDSSSSLEVVYYHESPSSFGSEPLAEGIQAVRGFQFQFLLDGKNFECVDLDDGGSRKYFDQKDADGRRKFIRRFAERRKIPAIYMDGPKNLPPKKLPFGFTAFISDAGGKFVIEEIVSYRDRTPPSRRYIKELTW